MQISDEKDRLRKEYRLIRSQAKTRDKDICIYERFVNSDAYKLSDTLFVYYSVKDEADTVNIIRTVLSDGKRVALPKCTDRNGNMEFYFIKDIDVSLTDGAFSLKEPDSRVCSKALPGKNNLCVVPALAFDKKGNRLGYGGGYYDRFLSNFKGRTVGLCYEECLCDRLPCESHDLKVDVIITDEKIYEIK